MTHRTAKKGNMAGKEEILKMKCKGTATQTQGLTYTQRKEKGLAGTLIGVSEKRTGTPTPSAVGGQTWGDHPKTGYDGHQVTERPIATRGTECDNWVPKNRPVSGQTPRFYLGIPEPGNGLICIYLPRYDS